MRGERLVDMYPGQVSPMQERRQFCSIVMPCLNEAEAIASCVDAALAGLDRAGVRGEVIVADNGSTDGSWAIAQAHGARVVRVKTKGYGAALRGAIEASSGDVILMGDSDGAHEWGELRRFIDMINKGYDIVIGNRFEGDIRPGAMPWMNRYLGGPFFSWILARLYRVPIKDIHCGIRAFTREAYGKMNVTTTGMEFASEMIVKAVRTGLSMTEIPVTVHPPKRSRKPHLRPFRDGWRHLRFLLSYAPNYLYLAPGLSLLGIGVVLQLMLIAGPVELAGLEMGIHFLALGSLMALVGFSVCGLGILAKVITAQRDGIARGIILDWIHGRFTINAGIAAGMIVLSIGIVVDAVLVWQWFYSPGDMTGSVHLSFVMTTMIALGLQLIFGSFLLDMLLDRGSSIDADISSESPDNSAAAQVKPEPGSQSRNE